MLKTDDSMKELKDRAAEALKALLKRVTAIALKKLKHEPPGDRPIDFLVHIDIAGRRHTLAVKEGPQSLDYLRRAAEH